MVSKRRQRPDLDAQRDASLGGRLVISSMGTPTYRGRRRGRTEIVAYVFVESLDDVS